MSKEFYTKEDEDLISANLNNYKFLQSQFPNRTESALRRKIYKLQHGRRNILKKEKVPTVIPDPHVKRDAIYKALIHRPIHSNKIQSVCCL